MKNSTKLYTLLAFVVASSYGYVFGPAICDTLGELLAAPQSLPSATPISKPVENEARGTNCHNEDCTMADTGWQPLTLYTQSAGVWQWVSPSNAAANDGAYTTELVEEDALSGVALQCLELTSKVPTGATIDGIEVRYEVKKAADVAVLKEDVMSLNKGGVSVGTNLATITPITTSDVLRTLGGPTEKWGIAPETLLDTYVNASDFGLWFAFINDGAGSDTTVYIDYVEMKVYYTPGVTSGTADMTLPGLQTDAMGAHIGLAAMTLPGMETAAMGAHIGNAAMTLPGLQFTAGSVPMAGASMTLPGLITKAHKGNP